MLIFRTIAPTTRELLLRRIPQDSPGGWNIIGNCPIPLFNPKLQEPCFVKVGDKVQFHAISKAEYDLHKIEGEVGIYKPEKVVLDA